MKLKLLLAALGTTLAIASLWLGAYGCHNLPEYFEFPCFATTFFGFWGGVAIAIYKPIKDSLK